MNKKFSTLMASMLLAGGLFNAANAEVNLAGAAEDGGYYYVYVQGNKYEFDSATDADVLKLSNGVLTHVSAVESDETLWKVEKSTINNTVVYSLKNKAGNYLSFTTPNGDAGIYSKDATISYFTADQYDQLKVYGVENGYLTYDGSSKTIEVDVYNTTWENGNVSLALSLAKVGSDVVSAKTLNAYLGTEVGFKIQIGNLAKDNDDNSFVSYANLSGGNPFDGILYASSGTIESVSADGQNSYFLQKGDADGDYIVLLNQKWDNFNTDHDGDDQKGYKFAVVSKEDLKTYLQKDKYNKEKGTAGYTPIIKAVKFTIEESVNSKYIEVSAIDESGTPYELLVSSFGNQTVLTTAADKEDEFPSYANKDNKTYVKFGAGNVADPKTWLKKDSYYTVVEKETGKVLGLDGCNKVVGFYAASEVQADMPEGMWAVTYTGSGNYTFTNREANVEAKTAFVQDPSELYVVDAAQNLYEWGGIQYIITAHAIKDLKAGYADLDVVNTKYVAGIYSPIHKGSAWFVENHSATSHQIGLDTDEDNATIWTLVKKAKAGVVDPVTDVKSSTDSLYVIHSNALSYWDASAKAWKHGTDTLKAVSYQFVNEYNEALGYNTASKAYAAKETAKNFVLKKVGDYYNMVEVTLPTVKTESYASFARNKVYGGDSAEKGLLAQTCMYERTENDIIEVKPVAAAMYRKVVNNLDTISIYRQENDKQMLFEDGKFLGLKNATQFDFAPAMLADTAYVRYNTYRPQYMLVLNPEITPAGMWCEEHQSSTCAHAVPTKGWIEGRYLVNLKDTAIAYNEANKHPQTNPYINTEKYYRLGFVQAKHIEDSLIIASTNDTLIVGTPDYNAAKFAFRYVDQEAGSFVIETANFGKIGETNVGEQTDKYGYIKWMNGVVVVVDDINNADVFNMNENEEGNPTANETIAAGNVVVAGTNGAVVVKGAEGKSVIVSTILGKVVANEVLTSDNAQITAPAGVVVVSVDGESFKVVVK